MTSALLKALNKLFALGPGATKLEFAIILGLIFAAGLSSLIAVSDSLASVYTAVLSG